MFFSARILCELCKSKLKYCIKSTVIEMWACIYCLSKQQACSLNVPAAGELCKVDADRDLKEMGAVKATALMSMAVVAQAAGAPEAMEEDKGSIVKPSPVPEERAKEDHAEGLAQQHKQHKQLKQVECKLLEVTAGHALLAADVMSHVTYSFSHSFPFVPIHFRYSFPFSVVHITSLCILQSQTPLPMSLDSSLCYGFHTSHMSLF